jgi:transcriptional regulator with XRE-family HTH domain
MQKDYTVIQKKFGDHLRKIRESKELSLRQVSYNCELDDSNISKIEHGKFNVTLATIIELAKGLDVPAKKLLDFEVGE